VPTKRKAPTKIVKVVTVDQRKDGSRYLVQRKRTPEDIRRHEFFEALHDLLRGDCRALLRLWLSGRRLDTQERHYIGEFINGRLRLGKGNRTNYFVQMAADEYDKRRKRQPNARPDAIIEEVAADFGVKFDTLKNLIDHPEHRK
jgi:hypothetical protein